MGEIEMRKDLQLGGPRGLHRRDIQRDPRMSHALEARLRNNHGNYLALRLFAGRSVPGRFFCVQGVGQSRLGLHHE